jgi:uncharacterized protein YgbK (DUF1537 family)
LNKEQNILLAFYGDDLTGSTDALEFISRAGAKAILFLEPPTKEQLDLFPGLQAYGIAGLTRSLPPDKIEKVLLPAFQSMKASGAKHVHYKICSTFDSSPQIGSIGKAIDCGAAVFENKFIPVLGGMPALGRYCVFGNLFAKMGIGSSGNIYRLDRHPSMSKHPVTPAHESDLRVHLGAQTSKSIGLIDVTKMDSDVDEWDVQGDEEVVLVDALTANHLNKVGQWLDQKQKEEGDKPVFSVGSSGIEMALGNYWQRNGILKKVESWQTHAKSEPLLVLSGSCSPVSKKQINYAVANGFAELHLEWSSEIKEAIVDMPRLLDLLKGRQSVIVHTGNI